MDGSGVNVATTKFLGQFTGSQAGVGSDIVDNRLEVAIQQSIGSIQDSRDVASYLPLSGGVGGSPAEIGSLANSLGLGENMPTDPYTMGRDSDGVLVSLSLLLSVCRSDQPGDYRQYPGPNPNPKVFLSTTPEQ